MRSVILIFLAILAFAMTPAHAQGTWLETRMIRSMCNSETTPAASGVERLGGCFRVRQRLSEDVAMR